MKRIFIYIALFSAVKFGFGQSPVQFGGYGRGWVENNYLPKADTANLDQSNKGHTLLDIKFDVTPNDNIRINSILRLRNELGGFWGEGQFVDLRQIQLKGVAGGVFKYQFGDIDLQLTPYTLFNSYGDTDVNEASVFSVLRDVNHYENFNNGNNWRVQGGQGALRLGFSKLVKHMDVQAFMTRNRRVVTNNLVPDRLYGGAAVGIQVNDAMKFGANYVSLFDISETAYEYSQKYANRVATADFKFKAPGASWYLKGETGMSITREDSVDATIADVDGNFFEIGAGWESKDQRWQAEATFRNVDDEFFSAGAQTKRINFDGTPAILPNVNATSVVRNVSLLDITRDYELYNLGMAQELMAFDPRLNNATPYGKATPNRRGVSLNGNFVSDSTEKVSLSGGADFLTEHVAEGTPEKRQFLLLGIGGDLQLGALLGMKNRLVLTTGYQLGITQRGLTEDEELSGVDAVDYQSHLIDAGLDVELFKRFDLLLGAKMVLASGTEYLAERDEYNVITGYEKVSVQDEYLLAAGLRYRFNENIHLTIQGTSFTASGTAVSNDNALQLIDGYTVQQLSALFNLHF